MDNVMYVLSPELRPVQPRRCSASGFMKVTHSRFYRGRIILPERCGDVPDLLLALLERPPSARFRSVMSMPMIAAATIPPWGSKTG